MCSFYYICDYPRYPRPNEQKTRAASGRPFMMRYRSYFDTDVPTPFSLRAAWAAASRAMGTRKGEQLT